MDLSGQRRSDREICENWKHLENGEEKVWRYYYFGLSRDAIYYSISYESYDS